MGGAIRVLSPVAVSGRSDGSKGGGGVILLTLRPIFEVIQICIYVHFVQISETYVVAPRVIIGRNVEHIQEQSQQYEREVGREHAGVV